ncbi:MAG: dipeptidase, partial [Gammaproteobacteria bacterium]|nr:dipeptidase [Gammaproteobacteria bacterium]
MKKLITFILILLGLYFLFTVFAPPVLEKGMNKVTHTPPYSVSDKAQKIYASLDFIGDLHTDSLLWKRDLSKKSDYGHVDIPRLREARVSLQAFTIVTKSPKGLNMHKNDADARDDITLLSIGQAQPPRTWFSLIERALYQSEKLHALAAKDENFRILKSADDLLKYLSERQKNKDLTAGFLGIEGAHALEGQIENVDRLHAAGIRMMAATHFFDNELGGSAHGISGEGLTDFGQQVVKRMDELGMIHDLAHISPSMIDDVLNLTTQPVLVSHTGVKGVLDSPRNLSDAHIKRIASNGGLIGIAFFPEAAGPKGTPDIVASMKYVRDLVGIEHVALGSDYDGTVTTPFDVTGLPLLVDEMLEQGFKEAEIRAVMGENMKR